MIFADQKVYSALTNNEKLTKAMAEMQTNSTDDDMIFIFDIPEQYQGTKYAPIIRVNYIGNKYRSSDDDNAYTKPRVCVSLWTKTFSQGTKLLPIILDILKDIGFYRYADSHTKDPDTADQVNKQLYMFQLYVNGIIFEEEE